MPEVSAGGFHSIFAPPICIGSGFVSLKVRHVIAVGEMVLVCVAVVNVVVPVVTVDVLRVLVEAVMVVPVIVVVGLGVLQPSKVVQDAIGALPFVLQA